MEQHGRYIVIEGPDGTGKTTQAKLLVETLRRGGQKSRYVHEPGETPIGFELEEIIKNPQLARSPQTNLLLFTANRLETYKQVIQPALATGQIVVSDRNWLSSIAYQGVAGRVGIDRVYEESKRWLPDDYMQPAFTILLYVPSEQHRRMLEKHDTGKKDYFESKPNQFRQDLLKGYAAAEELMQNNGHACCRISAGGSIKDVHQRIMRTLREAELI